MSAPTRKRRQPSEEERLEVLRALAPDADRAVQNEVIGEGIEDKHYRVVAKAARLAEERGLREQIPRLLAAFPRFLEDPLKKDPQCIAKQAIVRALVNLDCSDVDFYLTGIRYQQLERGRPAPGEPPPDSATDVRSSCAMGLIGTGYPRAVIELTTLLTDPQPRVRAGAARAISYGMPGEAEAVLRLKVLSGDREPEVLGECFAGLLRVSARECVPFVADFLDSPSGQVRDYAALALGESRQPEALEPLRAAWEQTSQGDGFRGVLIRAAAVLREPAAMDWLLELIEHGTPSDAHEAQEALSVYERDSRLGERLQAALHRRQERQHK